MVNPPLWQTMGISWRLTCDGEHAFLENTELRPQASI